LRCLGLTLFGVNRRQAALLFRGSGGNGKSTLLNVLRHVLGGYAASCNIQLFLAGRDEGAGSATPHLIPLVGARAMLASEPDPSDVLSAKRVKGLTGGESIPARGLNKEMFFFTPNGVPILSFNRTPKIKGEDEGLWRRLHFVTFDVNLSALPRELRRDPDVVLAELKAEGSGILNRLLEGFVAERAMGLAPPPSIVKLKEELRGISDPVGEFFADNIEVSPGARISAIELYEMYSAWATDNGASVVSSIQFGRLINEKGLAERFQINGRKYYRGVRQIGTRDGVGEEDFR
jgi:P4 family phage/plasmid primase-like protien